MTAVLVTWYERYPKSKAHAIRLVLRRREFAHLKRYSMRYLEKQFLGAAKFWMNPYRRLHKAFWQGRISGTENELVEQKIRSRLFS